MCNLINIHKYIPVHKYKCEWHIMTRMTGPDCAVMCNLININTYIHTYNLPLINKRWLLPNAIQTPETLINKLQAI